MRGSLLGGENEGRKSHHQQGVIGHGKGSAFGRAGRFVALMVRCCLLRALCNGSGCCGLAYRFHTQPQRQQQHRHQHPENHAPAIAVDDHAAQYRPHGRRHGGDQRAHPHQQAQPAGRCLPQNDVEHQGQRNTGGGPLYQPPGQQHRKVGCQRAQHGGAQKQQVGHQKQRLQCMAPLQKGRQRHHQGQCQQIPGGEPLHGGSADAQLTHQGGKGDVHGRLAHHPGKRHQPGSHDGGHQAGADSVLLHASLHG